VKEKLIDATFEVWHTGVLRSELETWDSERTNWLNIVAASRSEERREQIVQQHGAWHTEWVKRETENISGYQKKGHGNTGKQERGTRASTATASVLWCTSFIIHWWKLLHVAELRDPPTWWAFLDQYAGICVRTSLINGTSYLLWTHL